MTTCEDGVAGDADSEDLDLSRRCLLRGAGRRFALAASGLLLPVWVQHDDAEAREGLAGHELGGRRGENRRGRDKAKRRKRANAREKRRDAANAPGWSLIKYVSFQMQVGDSLPDVRVNTYYRIKGEGEHWSSFKAGQTFTNLANPQTYAPERYSIAAFIQASNATPLFIEARNPLVGTPWISVTRGGRIDGNGNYVDGSSRWGVGYFAYDYLNEPQNVNQPQRFTMSPDQDHVPPVATTIITRMDDTDSHKVFSLYIRSGWTEDACNVNTNCYP